MFLKSDLNEPETYFLRYGDYQLSMSLGVKFKPNYGINPFVNLESSDVKLMI